jgi:adenosylmethionine-8-amino-7-oxononanoate aminotransferase
MSNHETLVQQDKKQLHPLHHVSRHSNPLVVDKAEGVWLHTTDGRKILDGMAGLWNVNIGYGNKELPDVAREQMLNLAYTSGFAGMTNPPSAMLADKLAGMIHPNLNTTNFTSGGSESSDTSFKTARYYWQQSGRKEKTQFISRKYGYHGITLAATAATGLDKYHTMFGPLVPGFIHIPNPNSYRYEGDIQEGETVGEAAARALEAAILREGPETVAAFIAEPIQGAGGLIVPPDDYFPRVQEICRQYEVLMIIDEVICGFGRTGKWFGLQHYNIEPDIVQFAKGVTSGYIPLGGIQISDAIRDVIWNAPADQSWMTGYTYSGHAAACAVALANIGIIERENLVEKSAVLGVRLLEGLQGLVDEFPQIDNARGVGLLCGIEVVKDKSNREADADSAAKLSNIALQNGLRVRPLGNTIAFSPPLSISEEEVDTIITTLADAITSL